MRPVAMAAAVLAGVLAAFVTDAANAAEPAKAKKKPVVAWQKDLKAAQKLSAKTGRPILIVFGADWCTHCHKFEDTTLANPTMAGYINKEFVPVHLDFDECEETAQVLEVEAIPCTVILSPEADLLGKVVGAKPAKDYWEALQDAQDEQLRIRQARFAAASSDTARR